jgi:glutathione peroxidase
MQPNILLLAGLLSFFTLKSQPAAKTIYDFKVTDLDGKTFDMNQLKGKKLMIVNTASECGFTPQYKELQELYMKYKDKNFVLIGFPANNFGGQEPGTSTEIRAFCTKNYGVTFPMMSKVSVKGDDIAPIYKWLQNKSENSVSDGEVKWNFHKFLIDEKGQWVKSIGSKTKPESEEIIHWIEGKN